MRGLNVMYEYMRSGFKRPYFMAGVEKKYKVFPGVLVEQIVRWARELSEEVKWKKKTNKT